MRYRLAVLLVILLAVGDAVLLVVSVFLQESRVDTHPAKTAVERPSPILADGRRTLAEERAEIAALREEVRKWQRLLAAERRTVTDAEKNYRLETVRRFRLLLKRIEWARADPPCKPQGLLEAVHEKTGLTFVLIPPGSFQMGSPEDEVHRDDDEALHPVTIRRAFLLCETACTQAAWERGGGKNHSEFEGPDRPVECVSWEECHAWCQRNGLRLPSEAEWEYACRAGTTTPFSFGATITPSQVNYNGNYPYAGAPKGEYREQTVAAGSLPPNPWGLFEMHGNVWEWCEDLFGKYEEAPDDGRARTTRGGTSYRVGASYRVGRGGGWNFDARYCRSAVRNWYSPSLRWNHLGFRPAVDLPPLGKIIDGR